MMPSRRLGNFYIAQIVSFIVGFGITKASCNLFAARLSETWGRKKVLVLGWLIGLPVPFMLIWANHWWWFDVANILLSVNKPCVGQ